MKLNKISADMVSRRPDQTAEWLNRLARQVDIVESEALSGSKKPSDLPIATTYSLGVVKIGQNLSITPEGVLSALAPTSYNYELLFNKPKINNVELIGNKSLHDLGIDIPTKTSELLNDGSDSTSVYVELDELATVATSGSYTDLINKPTIGNATLTIQKNSTDVGTFTANATSNKTIDISVPTQTSDIVNNGADGTSTYVEADELATVATSGSYSDLLNKPTIGNATLTVQKNGTSAGTFTANATSNKTINITVPTTAADVGALPDTTKYAANLSLTIDSSTFVVTGQLKDQDGNNLGSAQTVDLPLESVVVSGSYDSATKEVVLVLESGSEIRFSVADLVSGLQSEITSANPLDADLVDDSTSTNKFVTATDIAKLNGIQAGAEVNVQSNWTEADSTSDAYILNKPSLATVATSGDYNDLSNKPTIGNATLTIQKNGTNVQTFTANATSNKTANITVPTKTSDITNDGADGTSTYVENDDLTTALAGKQDTLTAGTNINLVSNTISTQTRGIEYIVGTQASATNLWTGVSTDDGCSSGTLYTGKTIVYHLPVAGNSSAATLNLTLSDGTTTGAKGVKYNTGGNITTTYGAGCDIFMVYDGTNWKTSAWYDSNNYDRLRHQNSVKAQTAITSGRVCVGSSNGYNMVAANGTFDINYNILYAGTNISAGSTNNNLYEAIQQVNLQNTKSGWTGTTYKMVWLVGTLSGVTFTIDSNVFTDTIPSTEDGKTYTPIGILADTKTIYFYPSNAYWQYKNGEFRPISHSEPVMTGASSGTAGASGLVPAPAAGDDTKFLSGDGLWKTVSQYSLPIATANDLGGIKVGSRLTINSTTGVLSADSQTDNNFTTTLKNKLDGIAAGAEVNVQADWNEASSSSDAYIRNKPTIPTVNNGTLTIQKNGTDVQTFTANQSTNATANITVPTKTSDITNDSGFITSSALSSYLPLAGGTMTGAVTRNFGGSGAVVSETDLFIVNGSTDGAKITYTSDPADTGVFKIKTIDDSNAAISLGNTVSGTYKEAINIVNGSATIKGSVSGSAGSLATPRTIALGTGATGTATAFDGSSNITIPVTDVKDSYVTWGGKALTTLSPDDMGCTDEFGHNKLAFLPAECVDVAYSTDGGTTWVDYGATDSQKMAFVTTSGSGFYSGGSTAATAGNVADLKLRIRLATGPTTGPSRVYTITKKFLFNVNDPNSGATLNIRYRTIGNYKDNIDTWTTVAETYNVRGGSGWNSIPLSLTFGGSFSNQLSQIGQIEFVFGNTQLGTWGQKKMSVIDMRMIGVNNWTMPSEMARAGHIYKVDIDQSTRFPNHVYPETDASYSLGTSSKKWKNLWLSGSIYHGSAALTLPSTAGTLALTSDIPTVNNATLTIQKNSTNVATFTANASSNVTANISVPTKTSDITNDSGFITAASLQDLAVQEGSTQPVFDGMTPIKTFTWTVADTTYRPVYQFDNTGWDYDNMDLTIAYRITVTGSGISQVTDIIDRWFSPTSWPVTSIMCRTLSTSNATAGYRYLRAVYPQTAGLNNNAYKFGQEISNYNSTSRTIQVDVFKTATGITWNETKPAGTIYTSSTYQSNNALTTHTRRGWVFRAPASFNATSADSASRISSYEQGTVGSSNIKSGNAALSSGHLAFMADDGLVYDISNTTKNMVCDENAKIGAITSNINANTAFDGSYMRCLYNLSSTYVGNISHGALALGDRVYLRCTMDSSGNIHSDNYLATSMSAGYTWVPFGIATASNTIYMDVRKPTFYTLNSAGKLTHINGKETAPDITVTNTDPGEGVSLGEDEYIAVYGASTNVPDITLTSTDPGEGVALGADEYIGVYGQPNYADLIDVFYPVGSYYETSDTSFNPNTAWGGTWVEDTSGRVLVAQDSGTFSTVGNTGGSEYIQNHTHDLRYNGQTGRQVLMSYNAGSTASYDLTWASVNSNATETTANIIAGKVKDTAGTAYMTTGTSGNLQPYVVIKRWHRTA